MSVVLIISRAKGIFSECEIAAEPYIDLFP